ncbi:hypothetical protein [Pectobacterium phage MA14]|nr:hypothetical protein [Pectobacterium phage MA14]
MHPLRIQTRTAPSWPYAAAWLDVLLSNYRQMVSTGTDSRRWLTRCVIRVLPRTSLPLFRLSSSIRVSGTTTLGTVVLLPTKGTCRSSSSLKQP